MSNLKIAKTARNLNQVEMYIAQRKAFVHASMSANYYNGTIFSGKSREFAEEINDLIRAGHELYIIVSYSTPIAYIDLFTGEEVVTNEKFSLTTSRHTSLVRKVLCLAATV